VTTCAVNYDGLTAIAGSNDGRLRLWDIESQEKITCFRAHRLRINKCAVMPDGSTLVSASEDKKLGLWNIKSGKSVGTL